MTATLTELLHESASTWPAIVVAVAIVTVVFLGIIVVSAVIWLFLLPR